MRKTHHFETRKNNRGISEYMVDMAFEFGDTQGDKVILGKRKVEKLLSELSHLQQKLMKICDKNGLVVVIDKYDNYRTTYSMHKMLNRIKT